MDIKASSSSSESALPSASAPTANFHHQLHEGIDNIFSSSDKITFNIIIVVITTMNLIIIVMIMIMMIMIYQGRMAGACCSCCESEYPRHLGCHDGCCPSSNHHHHHHHHQYTSIIIRVPLISDNTHDDSQRGEQKFDTGLAV